MDESRLNDDYGPQILYFALRRLHDRALAEEILQETLTVVIQALRENRVREEARLPGYVFTVAKNLVQKAAREQEESVSQGSNPDHERGSAPEMCQEATLLQEEERQQVQRALEQLNSTDYELLNDIFVAEKSLEDIAKELRIPYAAVRKRKSRALERLKKMFLEQSQSK